MINNKHHQCYVTHPIRRRQTIGAQVQPEGAANEEVQLLVDIQHCEKHFVVDSREYKTYEKMNTSK